MYPVIIFDILKLHMSINIDSISELLYFSKSLLDLSDRLLLTYIKVYLMQ